MEIFFTQSAFPMYSDVDTTFSHRKTFCDGELQVTVEGLASLQQALVVANLQSPAENIVELLLLLDILHRSKIRIHLLITYYGYGRQDKEVPGQSFGLAVIADCLKRYSCEKVVVVHPHSSRLQDFLPCESWIPLDFFYHAASYSDYIVSPDSGAYALASSLAQHTRKTLVALKKTRKDSVVSIEGEVRDLRGKKVLIVDDMITTGKTLAATVSLLESHGAQEVYAAVTHGVLCSQAYEMLNASSLKKLWITNTIPLKKHHPLIEVIDIWPQLCSYMRL